MLYFFNGGDKNIEKLWPLGQRRCTEKKSPKVHREFLNNLQLYFESDDYLFVHAGIRPNVPLDLQDPHDLVWIREEIFHVRRENGQNDNIRSYTVSRAACAAGKNRH